MSIRFMLDSDVPHDLTGHAELIMTYSDLFPHPAELRATFPNSEIILIDRGNGDPSGEATVMDIETGALTIGDAPSRYDTWRREKRKFITVYVNRQNMESVSQAMGDRPHFQGVATLDGTVTIPRFNPLHTPAFVQCFRSDMLGMHGDGSLVLEDNWHPRPAVPNVVDLRVTARRALVNTEATAQQLHHLAALIGG